MAEPYETFGLFRAIIRINYIINYSSLDQEKALNKDLATNIVTYRTKV
jgi:hypothetical protein